MHGSQYLRQGGLPGLAGSGASAFPSLLQDCNAKPTLKVIGTHVRLQDTLSRLSNTRELPPGPSARDQAS